MTKFKRTRIPRANYKRPKPDKTYADYVKDEVKKGNIRKIDAQDIIDYHRNNKAKVCAIGVLRSHV